MGSTVRRNNAAALRAQGRACRRSCVGLLLTQITELLLFAAVRFIHSNRFSRALSGLSSAGSPGQRKSCVKNKDKQVQWQVWFGK